MLRHSNKLAENEPSWGSVDKSELPIQAFVWEAEGTDPEKKSTWKYPHHWVKDGVLYLHRGGLIAAWSAAHGARSGQQAEEAVIKHLKQHREALGMMESFIFYQGFEGLATVDKEYGKIKDVAIITKGVVKGHGFSIGDKSLQSAFEVLKDRKVKARFGHPSPMESVDPIDRFIGWFSDFYIDELNGCIRGVLELAPSAKVSPYGNMYDYILMRAKEDPTSFGVSIVCRLKLDSEVENIEFDDIYFIDIVGSPAANPAGLFESKMTMEGNKVNDDKVQIIKELIGAEAALALMEGKVSFEGLLLEEIKRLGAELEKLKVETTEIEGGGRDDELDNVAKELEKAVNDFESFIELAKKYPEQVKEKFPVDYNFLIERR